MIDYNYANNRFKEYLNEFDSNMICEFVESRKYDEIIKYAIKNHNKIRIIDDLEGNTLLHAKLIRDADKLDNFRVKYKEKFEDILSSIKEKMNIIREHANKFINNKVGEECV